MNTIASVFASAVNTARAEGLTSTGAQGGPIFSLPAPSVTPNAGNTGGATVTAKITNGSALPADGGPFLMTYNSTSGWSAVDQTTGQSYTGSGTPPSFAGLTLNVSGTPANGDQFVLNPAPNAATGISVTATSASDIASADPFVATYRDEHARERCGRDSGQLFWPEFASDLHLSHRLHGVDAGGPDNGDRQRNPGHGRGQYRDCLSGGRRLRPILAITHFRHAEFRRYADIDSWRRQ